jgi:PadR family transcriptional regulator, regulatory protein PadR
MDDSHGRKFQKDLNSGLVALVLLAVLDRTAEDLYGYEIAKRLQKANEGEALFKEGTVYPVLRALSANGLLTSRIVPSYAGPPRRYYRITEEGRAVLRDWSGIWRQTRDFVDRFIEGVEK